MSLSLSLIEASITRRRELRLKGEYVTVSEQGDAGSEAVLGFRSS